MNTDKTGGPAFPTDNAHQTGPHSYHVEGMTLRDWFAGMAMQSMINHNLKGQEPWPCSDKTWTEAIAEESYLMADAMLVIRDTMFTIREES